MKKVKILALSITFLVINQLNAQVLNVEEITQEENQWCWAGVTSCILNYYCTPTSQCSIAEYTRSVEEFSDIGFGSSNCCISPSSCNNWNYAWGGLGSIQDILMYYANIENDGIGSSLLKSEVISNIQENKLFVIRWGWTSGGGHFVVGHGISGNNMYYMDPWFGEGKKIASYSWVCSDGNHTWTHTNILTAPHTLVPAIGTITQPTCSVATGSVVLNNLPSTGTWTINPGDITGSGTSTIVSGLPSGINKLTVSNASGCTTVSNNILINEQPVSTLTAVINLTGNILNSNVSNGNQWFLDGTMISGATNETYNVTQNGVYMSKVTDINNCQSTSNSINVTNIVGIEDLYNSKNILISPNPNNGEFSLLFHDEKQVQNVIISNIFGQEIFNKSSIKQNEVINLYNQPNGVYFLRLQTTKGIINKKIVIEK